jgi:hypothetical protein
MFNFLRNKLPFAFIVALETGLESLLSSVSKTIEEAVSAHNGAAQAIRLHTKQLKKAMEVTRFAHMSWIFGLSLFWMCKVNKSRIAMYTRAQCWMTVPPVVNAIVNVDSSNQLEASTIQWLHLSLLYWKKKP